MLALFIDICLKLWDFFRKERLIRKFKESEYKLFKESAVELFKKSEYKLYVYEEEIERTPWGDEHH